MTITVLIVDDEAPARNRLRRMLDTIAGVDIVGEAANGQEAEQLLSEAQPDILLLDISMPEMDGMTLARMLQSRPVPPAVIFCTAWSDQAVEAFACDAVDYLVKPVRQERLAKAIEKACVFIGKRVEVAGEPMLKSTLGGKVKLLPLSEAIYFFAEDKYTIVIHSEGRLIISQTLLDLEESYADSLLRTHRSTLVAKDRVRGLEKAPRGVHKLILEGTDDRPMVSRRSLASVRSLIKELT